MVGLTSGKYKRDVVIYNLHKITHSYDNYRDLYNTHKGAPENKQSSHKVESHPLIKYLIVS